MAFWQTPHNPTAALRLCVKQFMAHHPLSHRTLILAPIVSKRPIVQQGGQPLMAATAATPAADGERGVGRLM
jgi:hypothetical protein